PAAVGLFEELGARCETRCWRRERDSNPRELALCPGGRLGRRSLTRGPTEEVCHARDVTGRPLSSAPCCWMAAQSYDGRRNLRVWLWVGCLGAMFCRQLARTHGPDHHAVQPGHLGRRGGAGARGRPC